MENRSDFKTIEYKLRKGHKQVNLLKMPGVNVVRGQHMAVAIKDDEKFVKRAEDLALELRPMVEA
eukprot:scaffold37153_cov43-Attheya_sp.AAC.3